MYLSNTKRPEDGRKVTSHSPAEIPPSVLSPLFMMMDEAAVPNLVLRSSNSQFSSNYYGYRRLLLVCRHLVEPSFSWNHEILDLVIDFCCSMERELRLFLP
jgi:hypothetical protein